MLEWRPRLITLILVVVLVGLLAGELDLAGSLWSPSNWEW